VNAAAQKSWLPYIVAAGLALMLISSFLRGPHPESIAYSELKTLVRKGKVSNLVLDAHVITGTLATDGLQGVLAAEKIEALTRSGPAAPFVTTRVEDPGLVSELEAANVKFTGRVDNPWLTTVLSWVVPMLLFVGVWVFLIRRMGGAQGGLMAVGKSRA